MLTTEQLDELKRKFGIAQDRMDPNEQAEQLSVQLELRDRIFEVAHYISENVELSLERREAHKKLEEALMWAGKAIFKEPIKEKLERINNGNE